MTDRERLLKEGVPCDRCPDAPFVNTANYDVGGEEFVCVRCVDGATRERILRDVHARISSGSYGDEVEMDICWLLSRLNKAERDAFSLSAELERLRGSVCGDGDAPPACGECVKCLRGRAEAAERYARRWKAYARKQRQTLEFAIESWNATIARAEAADAREAKLRAALVGACDLAEDLAQYPSEYLVKKWGTREEIARLRALATPASDGEREPCQYETRDGKREFVCRCRVTEATTDGDGE